MSGTAVSRCFVMPLLFMWSAVASGQTNAVVLRHYRVVVSDTQGHPVANATVAVFPAALNIELTATPLVTAVSNSDGVCVLEWQSRGPEVGVVLAPGFAMVAVNTEKLGSPITLDAGRDVRFRLLDSEGNAGTGVVEWSDGSKWSWSVRSSDTGVGLLRGLPNTALALTARSRVGTLK